MAIFGPQDILSRDDRETLYELAGVRAYAGALDRSLHIKTVPAALANVTRDFLDSARLQQRLSDASARHWPAVHLVGSAPSGAYLVTTHYPLSAEDLIGSEGRVSSKVLYRIVAGVVGGLRELRAIAHRAHGNLKPSNVLLADQEARGAVVLSDPAPDSESPLTADDARALGELIYALVMRQPVPKIWPIPLTKEWLGLGSRGRAWLRLCAALLHPNPNRQLTRLTRIAGAVRRLGPRPIFRPFPLAMGLAMLTLGGWIWSQGPYHVEPAAIADLDAAPAAVARMPAAVERAPAAVARVPAAVVAAPAPRPIPRRVDTWGPIRRSARLAAGKIVSSFESAARKEQAAAMQLSEREVGHHPPTVAAWHRLRDAMSEELRARPSHLPEIQARASAWEGVLEKLDRSYPASTATAPSDSLAWTVANVAHGQCEGLFAQMLAAVTMASTPPAADKVDAAVSSYLSQASAVQSQSRQLLIDLESTEYLLKSGYAPDEKPSASAPAANDLLGLWRGNALFKSEAVQTALQPLLAPLAALSTSQGLLQTAASPGTLAGIRLAAWRKLPPPATQEELKATLRTAESLMLALGKAAPPQRRQKLADEISSDARRRWAAFLDHAKTPGDIDFALSVRPGDWADDTSDLSRRTQYNILVHDLKRAMDAEKPSSAAIAELAHRLRQMAGLLNLADSSALVAALEGFDHELSARDFASLGPLTPNTPSADLIPWKVRYDPESQIVTYTAQVSPEITRDQLDLVFRRIQTPAGSAPVYLCTTEVSCGLFIDAVSALDKWRDMAEMLWVYDPREGDPRLGPRTWEWSRYRRPSQGPRRTMVWLAGQGDHYPPQLAVSNDSSVLRDADGHAAPLLNPSKRQPMQYVSPRAAIYFARLMGCRLQTTAEWKAAYAQFGCSRPNLRDHTWKIQARWASGSPSTSAYYPDGGIFLPSPLKPASAVWSDQAAGGRRGDLDYDDECLWFVEVFTQTQAVFNHLVGNVAEYAMDDTRMFVIGGSAMSPPSMAPDKPLELVDWPDSRGFSDVGMRLAFTAPAHDLASLKTALSRAGYLLAGH